MTDLALESLTGGALAVIILREVFAFLKGRREERISNGVEKSGEKAVEFWQREFEKIVRETFSDVLLPELERQTNLLQGILEQQQKMSQDFVIFVEIQKLK